MAISNNDEHFCATTESVGLLTRGKMALNQKNINEKIISHLPFLSSLNPMSEWHFLHHYPQVTPEKIPSSKINF